MNRLSGLSPCKEDSTMSKKSVLSDRTKKKEPLNLAGGNSFATSAFDRLRYNLSPVTSYYKPLMKSLSRRDESTTKVSNQSKL